MTCSTCKSPTCFSEERTDGCVVWTSGAEKCLRRCLQASKRSLTFSEIDSCVINTPLIGCPRSQDLSSRYFTQSVNFNGLQVLVSGCRVFIPADRSYYEIHDAEIVMYS